MDKRTLANKIAEDCGITVVKAKIIIKEITEIFKKYLAKEKKIEIRNFGSFKVVETKKRKIKYIGQKTIIELPPKKRIKFKSFIKL